MSFPNNCAWYPYCLYFSNVVICILVLRPIQKLIINLTIFMAWLDIIHMPCNFMLFAINDSIGDTHVISINLKYNTFYVPYRIYCNTVTMTTSCHRGLSTFEHREQSDLFLKNIVAVYFWTYFYQNIHQFTPYLRDDLFSWLIHWSLDKSIWDVCCHNIAFCNHSCNDCCLMTHGWTGSFIFCYVLKLCATICTSQVFCTRNTRLSITCFLTVSDMLLIILGRNTTLSCICFSLVHQISWSQPSNYRFRWICSWCEKKFWKNSCIVHSLFFSVLCFSL